MACFTKRLPVAFVPEQRAIPAMGCNVVDHSRGREPAFLIAENAQRMALQEIVPRGLPFTAISAKSSSAAQRVVSPFFSVLLAINAAIAKVRAAGIPAGPFRRVWHMQLLPI